MRKILVVITTNFVSWGGLTTAYMNYYRVLDKSKLLIDFASMNKVEPGLEKEVNENGGQYYQLSDKRQTPIKYLIDLNRLLRHKNYDVIHVHGNSATMAAELILALKNKIKIRIAHCHTSKTLHPIMNKLLYPFFIKSYTIGVACSKVAGDWLYPKGEYIILQNIIDTLKYGFNSDSREYIQKFYEIENKIVIGHVGKIYEAKNHIFLLNVFKKIHLINPNTVLLLVGDGNLRSDMEKWVNDNNLSKTVIFVGMQEDVSMYYSAMDIFVFPSLYEGLGLAAIEAQCSGLYCILSTNVTRETKILNDTIYEDLIEDNWVDSIKKIFVKCDYSIRNERSLEAVKFIKNLKLSNESGCKKLEKIYMSGEFK